MNTLENAIYMSMHNDVSFVIDSMLGLYEHQSTYSPNLPLRFLLYVSDLYSTMTREANLYGTKQVQIPTPRFLIFYNGAEEQPDSRVLKLSDSFEIPDKEPSLELEATLLNINPGHNTKLLKACKALGDYAEYTARVRKYAEEMRLEEAVERAINECIHEGILADFLSRNRSEAKKMSIYEYDEEKHMRQEREASLEEGIIRGENRKLISQICKKLRKGKSPEQIAEALEEELSYIEDICRMAEKYAPEYGEEEVYEEIECKNSYRDK